MAGRGYYQTVKTNDAYDFRFYAADFETTTAAISKTSSRVWSFCIDEIGKYEPEIYGDIDAFFSFCADHSRGKKKRIYFHNLKFDGQFILYHLTHVLQFKTAIVNGEMVQPRKLLNNEVVYIISDVGQWYYIAFRINGVLCEVRDSLKLLPFTLKQIGESFCRQFKKSEMNYDDKATLEDCTPADIEYIKNDVLVLSEALSFIMQMNGEKSEFAPVHSLTIGGACLQAFKAKNYGDNKHIMIGLNAVQVPFECNYETADAYIRSAYRGGYCYVKKGIEGKTINEKGFTADVNSLYPFVMNWKYSGNAYPFGAGVFHEGRPTKEDIESNSVYFYLRIRVSFVLRSGYVPTIQKKNSFLYLQNAYLTSSAMMDYKTGKHKGAPRVIELTLSKDDYILFCEHYKILSIEYLDYIKFMTATGIFDEYIEEYAKIKRESTGATRTLAKLFQNNLYGQMAKSDNSSYKVLKSEEGPLEFSLVEAHNKKVVNIAIGAAITAKARFYQITNIQNNLARFCYSDTDSLHCTGAPADFVGKIHNSEYGAYKIENEWTRAKFVRQKTYIEELTDGTLNICAAGMTPEQKDIFRREHVFEDFKRGLVIHGGKLKPKAVEGGVILEEVDFTIK